ncbi:hypothetical protein ACLQ24_06385, partial [Micromonospora sp. DT4]
MRSRGADRPDEGPDERRDPRAKGRRWGRGRAEAEPEEPVAGEEFGWIDDLRSAKQQRGELGPDGVPVEPVPPRAGVPAPPDAPPGPRRPDAETAGARRPVDGPWPGEAPPPGRRPDARPPVDRTPAERPRDAGPTGVPDQPAPRGTQPVPGVGPDPAAPPRTPPGTRPGGRDPANPTGSRPATGAPAGPARQRPTVGPSGPPLGSPAGGAPTGPRPEVPAPTGRAEAVLPLRRPDAVPPGRRPTPDSSEGGRPRGGDGLPPVRRTAEPAAGGAARFDGPAPGVAAQVADDLRPDPAIARDPRTARHRPGPVDPGAPEPVRPAGGGHRRAVEPDEPTVPRSGNAPPLPDASPTGAVATGGTATDGTGRRRAIPDEQERRTPTGGESQPDLQDRPERPADWLRQAGRLPHTDPGLPVVNRRGNGTPAERPVGRRTAPPPAGDLNDRSGGPLAVPDPAAERATGRRAAGPPADPGADAPTGRRAARAPESTGEHPTGSVSQPSVTGERAVRRRDAPGAAPDPINRRRRPSAEPASEGRPGPAGERGDDPYAGPPGGGRPAPGPSVRGARSAPPGGRARLAPGDAPVSDAGRSGPDGSPRPGAANTDGPARAAVPPGAGPDGPS